VWREVGGDGGFEGGFGRSERGAERMKLKG